MKHLLIAVTAIFLLIISQKLNAQDKHRTLGAYSSVFVKFNRQMQEVRPMIGGLGAIVINNRVSIGAFGNGMIGQIEFQGNNLKTEGNQLLYSQMGYGGIQAEYFIIRNESIQLSFPVKLGIGAVGVYEKSNDEQVEKSRLITLEPEVHFDLKLNKHLALSLQTAYRLGDVKDLYNINDDQVSGFNLGIGLKMIAR